MPLWFIIYFVGFVVALYICIKVMEDDRGKITFADFGISFLISLMSWLTVLALWVGSNVKHSEDHRNDDNLN